jgi:hypothetical protein
VTKATVTKLFISSLLAAAAGAIAVIIAVAVAMANGVFVMSGADVVDVRESPLAFSLLGLAIVGGLAILGGAVGGLVSWIGALLNTSQLESKRWFLVLLLLGIFNLGFLAMIAYVIAGPDGRAQVGSRQAPAPVAV